MLSAIRSRITYVNVVATLVLVFAMTGGAYAAKKYLITSTKQISPSVLKSLQGKSGAAGSVGAAGAQGPAGTAGPVGLTGSAGGKGEAGPAGSEGPQGKEGAAGAKGANGVAGVKGPTGPEGSPWTLEGTLPSGKTETGAWALGGIYKAFESPRIAISFPIPLEAALDENHVRDVTQFNKELVPKFEEKEFAGFEEVIPTKCLGTLASPTAPAGYLCVYQGELGGFESKAPTILLPNGSLSWGAAKTGATLFFNRLSEEEVEAEDSGTFAVMAP